MSAVVGLGLLIASGENRHNWQMLRAYDIVMGIHTKAVVIVFGVLHIGVAVCVLSVRSALLQMMILLWLASNQIMYRAAARWMHQEHPSSLVQAAAQQVGLTPGRVLQYWNFLLVYLILGSLAVAFIERWRCKRQNDEIFMRDWRKRREQNQTNSAARSQ